jgi:prepilin-type N-terminal cleavage/methylation domain-containing protein
MKYVNSNISSNKGFTLIEIIATIIIMGILSAFFIHFMGTALDNSWKSVELVAGEAEAEGKLEEIIAYFTSKINDDSVLNNPLLNALTIVDSEFSGDAAITMEYILFNAGSGAEEADVSGANRTLKVTVEAPGNNLTTILTQSRTDSTDPKVGY